jgi:serine/threonine protein kinase
MRPVPAPPEIVGRYALHGAMASGGMAVVHFGRQLGALGFSRPVAIKRVLPQLARDRTVRDMFIDEARLASRVRHPNVVPTLDVVPHGDELLLVMEYVHGESLQVLLRGARARGERVPLRIALAIASAILHGLHAAHEATSEDGQPLGIVHRDVSPQNVMVGVDGVPRVLDFGIARAAVRVESTAEGIVKGKLAYMAPEQLAGTELDRRADIYSTSIVLWEMLTGRRLFVKQDGGTVMVDKLLQGVVEPPSRLAPGVPRLLDAIVLHGLARSPAQRFATAREMALSLERVGEIARPSELGEWVESLASDALADRAEQLQQVERTSSSFQRSFPQSGAPFGPSARLAAGPQAADMQVIAPRRTSEHPTAGRPRAASAPSIVTPHQAMTVPVAPIPARRVLAVFFGYAALGAGVLLTVLFFRGALRVPATPPPLACPVHMVRVGGEGAVGSFCIDAQESTADGPSKAAEACSARGERLPTDGERDASSRGPDGLPPASPRAKGVSFRCVAVR